MIFFKYQIDQVPWNSMEFHETSKKFHGIPWNSMELFWGKLKVPWNSIEFHGTREYGKSSMEFHGTLDLDIIPSNSMEPEVLLLKFHGIPWNHKCCSNVVQKNSLVVWRKFHGTFWSKYVSMSIVKRFWMIFWYVMGNAGNECGIMQILIIERKLVKETYKTHIPRNSIQI